MTHQEKLGKEDIFKLLVQLSLPATVGMAVGAFYNVVDTIFIGKGVGTLGLAGVSLVLPFEMVLMAFSFMVGIGAGSMMSRSLGAKDRERVNYVAGNAIFCLFIIGVLFFVVGNLFAESIVRMFGATSAVLPYSITYIKIVLIGSIYFPFCMGVNSLLRAEGRTKESMYAMLIGFLTNIILDYIFIFPLKMGVAGAAWATTISRFLSLIYLIFYFRSNRTSIRLGAKYFLAKVEIIREMLSLGFSGFCMQVANSFVMAVLNRFLAYYGGNMAVAIYGIIFKVFIFLMMPLIGLNQGMQPIVGYNYGAKQYDRVKETITIALRISTPIALVGVIFVELFPALVFRFFSDDPQLINQGVLILRVLISMMWLVRIRMVAIGFFQSLGRALPSLILSILPNVLLLLPLLMILPGPLGLGIWGIWISVPLSDFISTIITFVYLRSQMAKLKSA